MVRLTAITTNQSIDVIILIAATITMRFSSVAVDRPLNATTAGHDNA